MESLARYSHTQKAPLCLLLYGTAAVLLIAAWFSPQSTYVPWVLAGTGILTGVAALGFHRLTVRDAGERLVVEFGPLPLFRTSIHYGDIQKIEIGRTLILDGWGIHLSVRGGWVWNLWGRDCVVVHKRKGVLRIGTDDAENLARFLADRISRNANA
jgi:hypothetical protein